MPRQKEYERSVLHGLQCVCHCLNLPLICDKFYIFNIFLTSTERFLALTSKYFYFSQQGFVTTLAELRFKLNILQAAKPSNDLCLFHKMHLILPYFLQSIFIEQNRHQRAFFDLGAIYNLWFLAVGCRYNEHLKAQTHYGKIDNCLLAHNSLQSCTAHNNKLR